MSDEEPVCPQKGPYQVTLEAGRAYFWCTCGRRPGSHSVTARTRPRASSPTASSPTAPAPSICADARAPTTGRSATARTTCSDALRWRREHALGCASASSSQRQSSAAGMRRRVRDVPLVLQLVAHGCQVEAGVLQRCDDAIGRLAPRCCGGPGKAERKPDAQCASTGPSSSPRALPDPLHHAVAEHVALDRRDVAERQACALGQLALPRRLEGYLLDFAVRQVGQDGLEAQGGHVRQNPPAAERPVTAKWGVR